jgi:hypothetical protein
MYAIGKTLLKNERRWGILNLLRQFLVTGRGNKFGIPEPPSGAMPLRKAIFQQNLGNRAYVKRCEPKIFFSKAMAYLGFTQIV